MKDIWGLTIQSDDDLSSIASHKSEEFSDEEEEIQDETISRLLMKKQVKY